MANTEDSLALASHTRRFMWATIGVVAPLATLLVLFPRHTAVYWMCSISPPGWSPSYAGSPVQVRAMEGVDQLPGLAAGYTARRDRQSMMEGIHSGVMPKGIKFSLAFLTGPMASTVRGIDGPSFVIGRDQGEIITHDPETSWQHASLSIHGDGTVWLTDLQSTNGTFVDGQPIEGTVQLMDRQEFTCGKSTFMLLIRPEDQFSFE